MEALQEDIFALASSNNFGLKFRKEEKKKMTRTTGKFPGESVNPCELLNSSHFGSPSQMPVPFSSYNPTGFF